MKNILALNLKVSNYMPISKDEYIKFYSGHNLKIEILIHLHIIWIIIFGIASFSLCWYLKFNSFYCISIASIYALFFIGSHYIANCHISKINKKFISQHHLTSLCSKDTFKELSEQEYSILKKIIEKNLFLKSKVKDIFYSRGENITTFDYIQLCIPEYVEYYNFISNHNETSSLKESLVSQLNKI
jgi:hypothetical protein